MAVLTVVTPTNGREAELRCVLEGLAAQNSTEFELILVCSANHPDPAAVEAAAAGLPFDSKVVGATGPGASGARNAGVRAAQSPLVLFLDDDVVPTRSLVREHLAWHERHPEPEVGVLGPVVWARSLRVTPFMRWLERGIQFDYANIVGEEAGWYRFYTANVSIKREVAEAVGGFDEQRLPFGFEDLDLAKRMHEERGFRLLLNREAIGEHLHEMTLEGWRTHVVRIAETERAFVAKHPDVPAHFFDLFLTASRRPPAKGRGRHLARLVPAPRGRLGDRIWRSADIWYRQQLAPDFLAAWDAAERGELAAQVAADR